MKATAQAERYAIYQAPGWHGQPDDPVICTTDDETRAAMRAGCRADIGMPGDCNHYDCYAVDTETGEQVEPIESYCCDDCGELNEWGGDGPIGTMDGEILSYPDSAEKHLVHWVCEDCASDYEDMNA